MKVVGLITEYNPFHNGHKHHIEEAKRLTGADYAIAVMSGNFVQRGTPALIDKYSRTNMALCNGIDLVLELPVCYATGSAEYFAHGAVSILDKLGVVDTICFGSECGDINLLSMAAEFLLHAPDSFEKKLQNLLKDGLTYPAARLKAIELSMQEIDPSKAHILSKVLMEPNNILGIEYIKAIYRLSSSIKPTTIQRISAHYHDNELSKENTNPSARILFPDKSNGIASDKYSIYINSNDKSALCYNGLDNNQCNGLDNNQYNGLDNDPYNNPDNDLELCNPVISSATAIRNAIYNQVGNITENLSIAAQSVPNDVSDFLRANYHITYPITEEDFAGILKYKLRLENSKSLGSYQDITQDLAERLKNLSDLNKPITSLAQDIKTKNMTLTRINRALIHILLNIKTDALREYTKQGYTPYARILGIRKESSLLLRSIEKNGRIPTITKVSKAGNQLDELGLRMLSEDIFATHIYNQAIYEKYSTNLLNEYKHGIIIV